MSFYYRLLVVEKCLEKCLLVNYLMFLWERINGKQISFNKPIILLYWLAGQHKHPHTRTLRHKNRTQFTLELGQYWMSLLAASKNNCVCRSNVVCRSGLMIASVMFLRQTKNQYRCLNFVPLFFFLFFCVHFFFICNFDYH